MGHERGCSELGDIFHLRRRGFVLKSSEKPTSFGCLGDMVPIADFSGWCDRIGEVSVVTVKPTIS
jgi:hypothetical protein